ncbi:hypothetical protein SAMN00017405_1468 [Desulfonispora thiosulfatigenes DSM 11270]|uniref:FAD-dependent protein C-terminal domain-containing protein n=1 Tax=Desulfonispora thiosulfatigenes DSM 11270 TaxID=656914 RepID=A0A1W1VSU3_DESTI|nr:NAD(P)/FAD-dependent oxidoreductase [Desulfonispora thiosulfatigenes]SMB96171.1 hypothetical protein SAMN00017405_1468 [Desulfonispora thiosulfatigenes DSM 11270]
MLRINNIKLRIDEDEKSLKKKIINILKLKENQLIKYQIYRKSIDARKKDLIYFIYTVDVKVKNEEVILKKLSNKGITKTPDMSYKEVSIGNIKLAHRPVIIGTGPSGLFAGLILAQMGFRPILLERGENVDERFKTVSTFWEERILNTESNVQFGEGGAGTFSDGKLTTLISDERCRKVLEEFIKAGAPESIIYSKKPHVGTDLLRNIVKQIRKQIIDLGGEVRFNSKVTDIVIQNNQIESVVINNEDALKCSVVLLGIGHSARDTFEVLYNKGIKINQKPFSIGVRIEHPQQLIDKNQYGEYAQNPKLGAADYKLVYHSPSGRSAYTFCMCPGGYVVASSSEAGGVVVNGMSEYSRAGLNANSAILVGVSPTDFESSDPLAGIEFQRKWERLAYKLTGESYFAPVQLVGDFLNDKKSNELGFVKPTYKPDVKFSELKNCLPDFVVETIKEALIYFDSKIKGFASKDAILTGVETRSSSPIRIERDENYQSNIIGLYPIGEGAGHAGGIMSSAVDGIRAAEQVALKYTPKV